MSDKLILLDLPLPKLESYVGAARALWFELVVLVTVASEILRSISSKTVGLAERSLPHALEVIDDLGRDQVTSLFATQKRRRQLLNVKESTNYEQ